MSVKKERITILGTPDFKAFLNEEASNEGVSVSELVRNRCQQKSADPDVRLLAELVEEANQSIASTKRKLSKSLKNAERVLDELKAARQ